MVGEYGYGQISQNNLRTSKFLTNHTFQEIVDIVGSEIATANLQPRKVEWLYESGKGYVRDAFGQPILQQSPLFNPVTYRVNPINKWDPLERVLEYTPERLMKRYNQNPLVYENPHAASGSPPRVQDYDLT